MTQSLKQKTAGALFWNFLDRSAQQAILFVVNIIVANLLAVEDYALAGMLAIFTSITGILIESGFSAALIQKKDTTEEDYSSVFWLNITVGVIMYFVLIGCTPLIARFFEQPQLISLSYIAFLALPINAFSIIQTIILNKKVRFDILARINLITVVVSGCITLIMAYGKLGVWTLVFQPTIQALLRVVLLWFYNSWRPKRIFNITAIRNLFRYSVNLLFASLINAIFLNIYNLIIGKIYPNKQLGYFTQSAKMTDMGVTTLYGSIQNATFPILSSIQGEGDRVLRAYRKTMRFTSFVTFPAMLGLAIIAPALIRLLLKEEWWLSIPFFQLLCIGGCFTIFTAINNNFIKSHGQSGTILKMEFYKIGLTVLSLALTYDKPVLVMVAGLIVTRFLLFVVSLFYTSRITGYKIKMQLSDLMPYLVLTLIMACAVYPLAYLITNNLFLVITQILTGGLVYMLLAKASGSKIFTELTDLILKKNR